MNLNLDLLTELANQSLALWKLPSNASVSLINVSENTTFLVKADDFKSILRIHRQGYHTEHEIQCELDWLSALNNDAPISTPRFFTGRDGKAIQSAKIDGIDGQHFLVMFEFAEGNHPNETTDETQDPLKLYEQLGNIAARCHNHAILWQKPENFQRLTWDTNAVFGEKAHWGNWRDAPNVTPEITQILECVETKITERLNAFGKNQDRFGLIHSDMRFANLLVNDETTHLIDFDDCGFSWFLYDFAGTVSFIENHPDIPKFKTAWLRGYRQVRDLSAEDEAEIDTFIMLRRMALLAWIGSHINAPEPQALAPDFARVTADLGAKYLV